MTGQRQDIAIKYDLDDDDKARIREIFFEEMVKKLIRLDARIGILNCEFAGEEYSNWTLRFREAGSGFEIVDFEYDENSRSFSLGL
ncbi:MAG: hypothetical protein V1689_06345 [Pseudomonadota bacterium]